MTHIQNGRLRLPAALAGALVATAALLAAPASAQTVVQLAHTEGEGDLLDNPYWAFTEVFGGALASESNGR